ncbi:MAG TPA: hypothetical protein VK776_03505 [Bryobacteraceae bacterium]|nr:hypothetical protein [Bryobacteraceae bacterium]
MTSLFHKRSLPALAVIFLIGCVPMVAFTGPSPCLISSNFNGTPIAGGNYVWFNSAFSLPGFDPSQLTSPLTITFNAVTITFTANGTPYTVNAPNASITYNPGATTATTTFTPGTPGQWTTTLPTTHLAGSNFLDAVEFLVPPGGLPGGIGPVTWQGTFSSTASTINVQWQWAAAVYTAFGTDYNTLGVKPVDDNHGSAYQNSDHAGTPENFKQFVTGGARGGGGSNYTGSYSGTGSCPTSTPAPPSGTCQASSSLSVLVSGSSVTSYVPKGNWSQTLVTDVSVVNIEGSSITPTRIPTPNVVNSCASNSVTGQTVCTANNTDVYLLSGTTLNSTLTSSGVGEIGFSGGACTNCGVAMDGVHNKAVIGLAVEALPGFQFLDLATSTFEPAFQTPARAISEELLIDPIRNLLLSADENGNYEIVNVATSTSPAFFENQTGPMNIDSSGEDCSTGIALAPMEFSNPTGVYIADLTQATFTAGSPAGTWTAPSQVQTLSESDALSLGNDPGGIAVAQGTHIGVVTPEFSGSGLTAIALPATSGSGIPAIADWMTCSVGASFSIGFDPHTATAYQSPSSGDAIALLANGGATTIAIVDLTKMLNPVIVPRTAGGHGCASTPLPSTVVSFVSVP